MEDSNSFQRLKILFSYNVCLYMEKYGSYFVYLYVNRATLDSDRCFDSVLFISPSLARLDIASSV